MAALTALIAGISAIGTAIGASNQASGERLQGQFEKTQFDMNARLAEFQGEDALARGEKAAQQKNIETQNTIGAQRASMAAQGINLDSGSALDVQTDTAGLGALDALTIRNNAKREAFGYKVQAVDYRTRGRFAEMGAESKANSTLLTGGFNALSTAVGGFKK